MIKKVKNSTSKQRRNTGKRTYYLACGSNVDGRLGIGGESEGCQTALKHLAPIQTDPKASSYIGKKYTKAVINAKDDKIAGKIPEALTISCGRAHTLCISKTDGILYGWGSNDKGQLGLGENFQINSLFQPTIIDVEQYLKCEHHRTHQNDQNLNAQKNETDSIPSPWSLLRTPIATLTCGYNHSLFITAKGGQVYSFGENQFGQLGLNDTMNRSIPTHISTFPKNTFFVSIAGGLSHSLALTIEGEVYSFGRGAEGQLGDGISGFNPISSKSGKLWGEDSVSQLHKCLIPIRVKGDLIDRPVVMIAASQGGHGSYAVTAYDGCGWRWGALDKEIPKVNCEDSFDDIKIYVFDEDKNMKTEPYPLPPPLGFISQRGRASSAPTSNVTSDINVSCESETDIPEISRRNRRSSSFDVTSEFVRNAACTATATIAQLSSTNESPPISPGSSLHLFPETHIGKNTPYAASIGEQHERTSKDRIIAFSAGARHLVCVTRAGEAFSMGSRGPYLGVGPACRMQWIQSACKMLLPGDVLINGVSCGEKHTLLSSTDGRIFVCGDGRYGMLGVEGKDLEVASCEENAVPKIIPLRLDDPNTVFKNLRKDDLEINSRVTVSTYHNESSLGCSTIFHNLQKIQDSKISKIKLQSDSGSESISYEDDEDYWGEEGLGHELEIDFNMGYNSSQPFGQANIEGESWKNRLSRETRRRLSSSTKAVGGVIFSTGGAVLSGVVSAVKSGIQVSDLNKTHPQKIKTGAKEISERRTSFKTDMPRNQNFEFSNIEHHQDSFNGLVGNARCRVMLSAGSNHSCVYIIYDVDE